MAGRIKGRADSITGKRDGRADSSYRGGHLLEPPELGARARPSLRSCTRM